MSFQKPHVTSLIRRVFALFSAWAIVVTHQADAQTHPRLFFDSTELTAIRAKLDREPFKTMLASMVAYENLGDFFRATTESDPKDVLMRAKSRAMLYALTGTESYATGAKTDVETALTQIGGNWASSSVKGLDSYWYATHVAICYDLCYNSPSWDVTFKADLSSRLVSIATMIINYFISLAFNQKFSCHARCGNGGISRCLRLRIATPGRVRLAE